jgi:rare lipoprotein A
MFKTLLRKVSVTQFCSFGFGTLENCFGFRYADFGLSRGARRFTSLAFPFFWLLLSTILLLFVACAGSPPTSQRGDYYSVDGKRYYPMASSSGFVQRGLASWYGGQFHGRLTSNGERYNMYGRTAAHKTLPFNTYVRVTNLQNGRKTIVRINDRGPFVSGRIIDLTYTSAHELAMVEDGVVPVKIEALGYARKKLEAGKWVQAYEKPASYMEGDFTIQVGAFTVRENALHLHASLSQKYREASVMVFDRGDQRFYRVRVGRYSRLEQAEAGAERLQGEGFPNAFAVARDR